MSEKVPGSQAVIRSAGQRAKSSLSRSRYLLPEQPFWKLQPEKKGESKIKRVLSQNCPGKRMKVLPRLGIMEYISVI